MSRAAACFRTRVTELFGIEHPLFLGGMHHLGESGVVAAVVNAGAMGFITARSFATLAEFRQDLRRCRDLTGGKPFGVNLTMSRRPEFNVNVEGWLDVALDEGVRYFESAGTSPAKIVDPIHNAGAILMHKCPSLRHALSAERLGVDVIALVGSEEGGHPGANKLSAFVNGAYALEALKTPLVLGGGIGTGRQIAAALALGAAGVVMGSRFMVASEVIAHNALKEHIISLHQDCSTTILDSLSDTWRVLLNETAREVQKLEAAGVSTHAEFGDLILSARTKERVYIGGDVDGGIVSLGPAGGFADRVESATVIVERLMNDAWDAANSFSTTCQVRASSPRD